MSMEQLAKSLYSATSSAVGEFIDRLVTEFQIDKVKAIAVWNASAGEVKIVEGESKAAKKTTKKPAAAKVAKADDSDAKKCQYVFSKGNKEGESCGSKVSDESSTGLYCKRHVDKEKTGSSDKKDVKKPAAKKATTATSTKKKAEQKESVAPAVKALTETSPGFKVNINKWRNYEHAETSLVFNRETEQVIGKQATDGSVTPLTADDIQVCKNFGIKYKLPPNMSSSADDKDDEAEEPESEEELDDESDEDDE